MNVAWAITTLSNLERAIERLEDMIEVETTAGSWLTRIVMSSLVIGVRLRFVMTKIDAPALVRSGAALEERWRATLPAVEQRRPRCVNGQC